MFRSKSDRHIHAERAKAILYAAAVFAFIQGFLFRRLKNLSVVQKMAAYHFFWCFRIYDNMCYYYQNT